MGEGQGSKSEQGTNNPPAPKPKCTLGTQTKTMLYRFKEIPRWSKRNRIGLIVFLILLALAIGHASAIFLYPVVHSRLYDEITQADKTVAKARRSIAILLADDVDNKNLPEKTKKNIKEAFVQLELLREHIKDERAEALHLEESATTKFFQIFSLLVGIAGAVGLVAYTLMKHDLLSTADKHLKQRVDECSKDLEKRIDNRIVYGSLMAEANAYQGMSYTFFKQYKNYFLYAIDLEKNEEERKERCRLALRDIELAKLFVNRGFDRLGDIGKKENEGKVDISASDTKKCVEKASFGFGGVAEIGLAENGHDGLGHCCQFR